MAYTEPNVRQVLKVLNGFCIRTDINDLTEAITAKVERPRSLSALVIYIKLTYIFININKEIVKKIYYILARDIVYMEFRIKTTTLAYSKNPKKLILYPYSDQ